MNNYTEKFEKMRVAGNLAAKTLDMLTENIKPGITTGYIDKLGYEFIRDNGGYSAPLFYRGFKKSLCTSLNRVVCHGIPSDRILNEGDAVNVDVTAIVNEHYGDTSRMFCVGKTPIKLNNLIDATYESMMRAIKILKPGIKLGDIGYEIQSYVENKGFSVVRDFCGHGIRNDFYYRANDK
jgi:methionyl aminopeptidase